MRTERVEECEREPLREIMTESEIVGQRKVDRLEKEIQRQKGRRKKKDKER